MKQENPMTQSAIDQYREYVDVIRQPAPPRGDINSIQLVTPTARVWWMRTKHSLADVLTDGYFDTLTDIRLMQEDTIQLVSSYGADQAEHSILIVTASDKHGLARVSLLHRYERQS
jgi:hypothetical protein